VTSSGQPTNGFRYPSCRSALIKLTVPVLINRMTQLGMPFSCPVS